MTCQLPMTSIIRRVSGKTLHYPHFNHHPPNIARVWLFGYDEQRRPLNSTQVFEGSLRFKFNLLDKLNPSRPLL